MFLVIKLILYFWITSIIWLLLSDELNHLFQKFKNLDAETAKSINLGAGFVLFGSGFFGLLSGLNFDSSELEIFIRIILAFSFAIIAAKFIKKGV